MFPMHPIRGLRHSTLSLFLLVAFAGIAGCGTNDSSDVVISPPGWVAVPSGGQHAKSATLTYLANSGISSCTECHGADLSGGTSKVSCFGNPSSCHHGPVAGWSATPPAAHEHGAAAKRPSEGSGFASCQICHGVGFSGGGSQVSCFTCHGVDAPHSASPWRASAGSTYTHTTTAETGNAAVCAQCHFPGSPNNPANHPATPAPAGTAPGCFNNTLCHGEIPVPNPVPNPAPHPVGNAWVTTPPAGQPHGGGTKAVASSTTGFPSCQVCHGTGIDFAGGVSGVSCYTCHGVSAPHSAGPWRASAGSTYTHTTTAETGNAAVCAFCHFPGSLNNPANHPAAPAPAGTVPGCFNNTLCHGEIPVPNPVPHPAPYNDNTHYHVAAGTFATACGACHDLAAPSSKAGPACGTCHAASPLTALNCTSCHAAPPDGNAPAGAAYPNIAGAHSTHIALNAAGAPIACDTCHNGLGTDTLSHYNRANARSGKDALRVPPGDIALLAEYNAMSGTSAFTAANRTCSNVICHGGQATPDWQTAADAIDVPHACLNCHVSGTTQYNSYNSGKHEGHITVFGLGASTCTRCHDVAKVNVSGHFQNLATPAFEQPASETILPNVRYDGTTCNPQAGGLTGCHKSKQW
ncbi:MAG TPA: CxxxxCH/CxxCH domain-containing protein [Candidatus Deferrimicrobiaceae bacterium]|nr:CxxxxCH/CxxCH domain-containing protein [Candidatus Deferrimicrobiaceae bacterium]